MYTNIHIHTHTHKFKPKNWCYGPQIWLSAFLEKVYRSDSGLSNKEHAWLCLPFLGGNPGHFMSD